MNTQNLHKLIDKYEENFYIINNTENDEMFKWRAAKQFRDVWFSEDSEALTFAEKFNAAKKEFSVLTDNSYVSPANGIVKIAEKEPIAVKRLFEEVLFANDDGNLVIRQDNLDKFVEEIDKLRLKHFPQSFKFKQDRHSASCYLAFYAPDNNFIYRYSNAEDFAQNIEFGKDIGSGENFRLEYYYEMCEEVVKALKEHQTLLDKHFAFLSNKHYKDESLHILAFDLMYCCKTYNFYSGMAHASKKESIKAYTEAEAREKERLKKKARITILENELHALEMQADRYADISLLNVEVYQAKYGKGIIIAQDKNKITVHFDSCDKSFVINKRFITRPTFENDEEIVDAFTEYDDVRTKIENTRKKLQQEYK